ncbi:hypothetical protein C8034_v000315 [Colletotrichum sidae]|uniref:Uncharacterized protein n=3 Tax=Colletotrichum orbiculare species complex TaxID=2707354 RepID=N4VLZ3_COLOR|nr:hypothetical protein Cob_v000384 [Colletotrichum orbiculare MAFF 240422]TDZ53914.1 hypothetical protein CTRI78_v006699 [Colletotrichum trifolii]TEA17120.1 hypothetical protein C8034_v000315 [Colletotrichum sidae]
MPSQIFVTEPHPTVVPNTYIYSGRGGAGNIFRAPVTTPASGITTPLKPVSARGVRRFYSGIGGAGNAHSAVERPVVSFDEDFDRQQVRDRATVGHVGIGGAGNVSRRKNSDASSVLSEDSAASSMSSLKSIKERSGNFLRRLGSKKN